MTSRAKSTTLVITVQRMIPAPPSEVFDAWLDAEVPGTPWNAAERSIVDPRTDGLFYWRLRGTAHYGRFTAVDRPERIQHTWVSPNTLGHESIVTVTFAPRDDKTLMTLVHSELPDDEMARGHEPGWNYFMEVFRDQFGNGSRKAYRWEDAHPSAARP
ncbi:MAG TPA: SRPBCC domain-containing protein [Gemmatimonadaceae bacterium]|jgi:uncharacterized protein YndB with AHSA1/START domain